MLLCLISGVQICLEWQRIESLKVINLKIDCHKPLGKCRLGTEASFGGARGRETLMMKTVQTQKKHAVKKVMAIVVGASFALSACTSIDPYTGEQKTSNTTWGAGIGALAGAVGGYLIGGGNAKDRRKSALIGAGIGALGGGAIGYYMDQQETSLRQRLQSTGVSVTRVGDQIILNMPGNVTFNTNASDINARFYSVLDSVATVLEEYDRTLVDIYGYTDSSGAADYNQRLSERRADSVAKYLVSRSIAGQRLLIQGMGESNPIATNATAAGKAQNRRVEIRITPLTAG